MYVCVCNAITDKQIRAAAESGTTDVLGLQAKLGVATGCGSCMDVAAEILAEYRGKRSARGSTGGRRSVKDPVVYEPGLGGAMPATA
jgi:bacterioferritin-associated ferredoxin